MRTRRLASLLGGSGILRFALLAAGALMLGACSDGPRDIYTGSDVCHHCHMTVSEERFASQLVTDRGRAYVFDSVECMAEFVNQEGVEEGAIRSLWVTDFSEPGTWIRAEDARFLRSDELRSPMGMNLSAHGSGEAAAGLQTEFGGEVVGWREVRRMVAEAPIRGRSHSHAH